MTADAPDLKTLALRLEMIADRLDKLEVQVHGLETSQTVQAKEFVVKDDRAVIRARLEMAQYAPCLAFSDSAGTERLKIGLRADSSPLIQVERRDIPLAEA